MSDNFLFSGIQIFDPTKVCTVIPYDVVATFGDLKLGSEFYEVEYTTTFQIRIHTHKIIRFAKHIDQTPHKMEVTTESNGYEQYITLPMSNEISVQNYNIYIATKKKFKWYIDRVMENIGNSITSIMDSYVKIDMQDESQSIWSAKEG